MKSNRAAGKELGELVFDSLRGHLEVIRIDLDADAVAAPFGSGDICRCSSHEGIEHGVAYKTEHADQAFRQFQRIRCRMPLGRSTGQSCPYLLKPYPVILGRDHAQNPGRKRRTAVTAGLAFHEDEFDVVLDNAVRLIRFAEEAAAIPARFIDCVGNLVPDDRCEIIESDRKVS